MPTTGTIPLQTVIPGQLIASALWNNEYANVANLMDAVGCGGYSATDAQMQIQTNPYPGSVTSHASSIAGELERIRYQFAAITGKTYWYQPPDASISSAFNSLIPVGGVIDYPVATAPNSQLHLADGTAISRAIYATLFSLIGTNFGVGDGATTFNLPDYRDRMSIGAGNLYSAAATGGSTAGALAAVVTDPGHTHTHNAHTHTMANHTHAGPSHTHTVSRDGWGSVASSLTGRLLTTSPVNIYAANDITSGAGGTGNTDVPSNNTSDAATSTGNSKTTGVTVSGTAATLPPYIGMYKMIRVL